MSYDDSSGAECVCDAFGEQANVIAKTVGVANLLLVALEVAEV